MSSVVKCNQLMVEQAICGGLRLLLIVGVLGINCQVLVLLCHAPADQLHIVMLMLMLMFLFCRRPCDTWPAVLPNLGGCAGWALPRAPPLALLASSHRPAVSVEP